MAVLEFDLSQLAPSMRQTIDRTLRDEASFAIVQAKARQKRYAKFCRDHPPNAIEGLGGITMGIDPVLLAKLRHQHKPAPGEEEDLLKWAARKDAEWLKVRSLGTRLQVGYWSTPIFRPVPKFIKTYERPVEQENPVSAPAIPTAS